MARSNQVLLHESIRVGADFDAWHTAGGGEGLQIALLETPDKLIAQIEQAGLRGLGGSGYPTHKKWRFLAAQQDATDKYLIVNGNEDEPGTFKDRILLSETPHQVIEGACICALACGINRIIFYINPEQHDSLEQMRKAVAQWEDSELYFSLAKQMGKPIELSVMESSGHYIGGEETAAIESVEGNFPFPRGKPPFPAESGVHGYPTLVNNTETLANVPHIMRHGADWFQALGIGAATGTKIYCLSGDVLRPGAYELPMGTPLEQLIFEHGGGMLVGKELKAVFTGGPSNTILTPKDLDVPLDFESVTARRSALGTGAMIVVSEGTGIVKRVTEYVNFFADSSCGQCPPCKTGTYYISLLLSKIDTGQGSQADLESLYDLCKVLPGAGRCHLLDGAVKVLESSLYHFRDEYMQAIEPR
ncbi:complex I 51 kDa subunit family protein [Candidatus Endoriftia persephone]|jgi:NADH-quinone oxidoreductase subunit F|uniref:NADH-quinone oxidoreductase subunit F n=2 Tax=Gammaproteobacteria TaxID=1236 RepID=G2D932_9GAMM|nr:NADH-ubiquinone oxidoreductase-F iron-sulfur binding region domain-containing protein [Candidatus Endoriftia persephone]EGV52899.1 NADH-quinone oxidoreductase subunit F 2 [endosymbiont of Riftia pachyptila (vent Ph05)]USF87606.1 SLBB domain-containing protein [Candidatus Endoriftia persephone]